MKRLQSLQARRNRTPEPDNAAPKSPLPALDVGEPEADAAAQTALPAPAARARHAESGHAESGHAESGHAQGGPGEPPDGQTLPAFPPEATDGFGPDAELILSARTDPEAFGFLYERYVDRIYSYVYHRVGNAQDAEDLTARTFHRALDALEHYEDRGLPFAAWLFRIAHNLVANWHRDRSRRRFLSLDRIWSQSSEHDDPEELLTRKETHDALWEAINRLPADRRDLLLYKFSGRMSNIEIGGLLKKSESAVKSLYFRTLAALRRDLEAEGWGGEPEGEVGANVEDASGGPSGDDEAVALGDAAASDITTPAVVVAVTR